MPNVIMQEQNNNRRTIYQELCNSYRAIDDFRAKLMGFLPLATSGVFLLYSSDKFLSSETKEFLGPIGLFGIAITLGLFAYEIYGIKKCGKLIGTGKKLEVSLCIEGGQFCTRPDSFINEPFASGIIYPAVLAAWMYLALSPGSSLWTYLACIFHLSGSDRSLIVIIVFLVGCVSMLIYNISLLKTAKKFTICKEIKEYCIEEENNLQES